MRLSYQALSAFFIIALFAGAFNTNAHAAPPVDRNDFQSWDAVNLTIPVTEKLSTNLELQNRLQNNWHNASTFFVRPSITYKLTPRLAITQGYSWDPTRSVKSPRFHNEQRIWEQLEYAHPLRDNFTLSLRTRAEERFVSGATGTGVRVREMVKLTHPIPYLDKKKYYWVTYDEIWVNCNTVSSSIHSGFAQNRAFVGVGKKLSSNTSAETGYLLSYLHNIQAPDKLVHALVFKLNFTAGQPLNFGGKRREKPLS